jgi:hypothetical protein
MEIFEAGRVPKADPGSDTVRLAWSADDIQREVALIECATPEPETPEMSEMGLHSGQVVIQHVDTVNVYSQVPAPLPEGDRMDRADRIQLGRHLLDRAEADRHTPEIGGLLAARWASAAFAHALSAQRRRDDHRGPDLDVFCGRPAGP